MSIFSVIGLGGSDPSKKAFNRNLGYINQGIGAGTDALNSNFGRAQGLLGVDRGGNAIDALTANNQQARATTAAGFNRANDILTRLGQQSGGVIDASNKAVRSDFLDGYGGARDAVGAGFNRANDTLTQLGSQLQGFIGQGAQQSRGDLAGGYSDAKTALAGGYGTARDLLQKATSAYDPMVAGGRGAFDAYNDSIGAAGQAGNDRALTNFQSSLGYRAGLDEGLEGVMRSAAARGQLAGGNTSRDLFDYASDHQNRQSQAYIDNLRGGAGFYQAGVAGQAAGLGAQADAASNYGAAQAGLARDRGAAFSALGQQTAAQRVAAAQGVGQARSNLQQQQGTALGNLSVGQGNALAATDQASALQRLNAISTYGTNRANVEQGRGAALSNALLALGAGQAGIYGTGAASQQGLGTGLANLQLAGMGALTGNSNSLAQAQNQQDGNFWNLLLGGAKLFAGAAGGPGAATAAA